MIGHSRTNCSDDLNQDREVCIWKNVVCKLAAILSRFQQVKCHNFHLYELTPSEKACVATVRVRIFGSDPQGAAAWEDLSVTCSQPTMPPEDELPVGTIPCRGIVGWKVICKHVCSIQISQLHHHPIQDKELKLDAPANAVPWLAVTAHVHLQPLHLPAVAACAPRGRWRGWRIVIVTATLPNSWPRCVWGRRASWGLTPRLPPWLSSSIQATCQQAGAEKKACCKIITLS